MHKKNNRNRGDNMNAEAREARNAYKREWCKRNPERVRKHQETYWSRKAAEAKERTEQAGETQK